MSAHGVTGNGHADPVARALATASGILPDQGPIGVFVHHNTLHAFQHLPFHEGVCAGAAALGARPYLSLDEFRDAWRTGRISDAALRTEIDIALGSSGHDAVLGSLTRAELWHTLLVADCDTTDAAGLAFTIDLGTAPQAEDRALWQACCSRVAAGPRPTWPDTRVFARHRDVLMALGADDLDVVVNAELIRLGAGYLDQGQARITMPGRDHGFLPAVASLYATAGGPRLCPGVDADMRDVLARGVDALTIIHDATRALGVEGDDVEPFVLATALALPGWAGMFSRLERHPDEHVCEAPATLADFMAVRLLLERRAIERAARTINVPATWHALRSRIPAAPERPAILDASLLWWLVRAAELPRVDVVSLTNAALASLWDECLRCAPLRRRQLFQEAYERTYRATILDAVAARRALPPSLPGGRPRAQFVFCIDEREESLRRAVEEQHPQYVTFGVAGFFGLAMDYRGLYDHEAAAHCPVVVTPAHEVHEHPIYTDRSWHDLRLGLRDRWHGLERHAAAASRTLAGGAGLSFLLGPLSGLKTLAQVLAPRSYSALGHQVLSTVAPRPTTRLSTVRDEAASHPAHPDKPVGFSIDEAADRVTTTLRNIGLIRDFAPIVVVLGHGSTSLNNPHESAHDCGACGGRRGGANARLFADMANRPDVREGVRARGVDIPRDVWFVGALHDTANDAVTYYDVEALPRTHAAHFDEARQVLERGRRENALERSRRFDDAPLDDTPDDALLHVEERSTLLAQPRPEYGHCTNSICIVGRRSITRGLHLDRRAFLVSYDATTDPDGSVIERILAAVGPVGAGISLEYYFSSVDNERFGCGTKLPHNVTGLIGVMNGHQSDLRTGLPLQMVEIHEPMRLLLIVEATPDALLRVASRQPEVAELVVGGWVQLVSLDPDTGAMAEFRNGGFVPYVPAPTLLPVVERSPEWHQRSRAHLPPALVRSALPETAVGLGHHPAPIAVGAAHG